MPKNKAACSRCRSGFREDKAFDGRPRFVCANCGQTWTAGYSGEPYTSSMANMTRRKAEKETTT